MDSAFLTIILQELLHTVITREPLAQQAQGSIVIGLTSSVRFDSNVIATASSSGTSSHGIAHHRSGPATISANPHDTVINLAINSASIVLLVAALWLVRHHFGDAPPERDGGDGAGTAQGAE